jgi:hypothetical protein
VSKALGMILVALGLFGLAWGGFMYTTREKIVDIGPILGSAYRILPISASGLRTAKLTKGARLLVVKTGRTAITWTHANEINHELVSFLREGSGKSAGSAARTETAA